MRFIFHGKANGPLQIMSAAYLFGVPLVVGFLQVYISEARGRRPWIERIFMPSVPAGLALLGALLLVWEGLICIIVIAPIMVIMAAIGGICAALVRDFMRPGPRNLVFVCSLVLPMAIAPLEQMRRPPLEFREVESAIEIHASSAAIWDQIKTVPHIAPAEQIDGWTYRIGFPRPIEATLDREGIGGTRRASFERGVLFVETITHWEPASALAFGIRADTASIPPTTLDDHVTVGGPYFDVLEGEYRIEPLGESRTMLHLRSRHRLSTSFNVYAGLWTDAIMQDIQRSILRVIRRRSEGAPVLSSNFPAPR